MPIIGPVYGVVRMLFKELFIFVGFFVLQAFIFAVIGSMAFPESVEYSSLTNALLTMFKASAGAFGDK
jgi:hypothetical protein